MTNQMSDMGQREPHQPLSTRSTREIVEGLADDGETPRVVRIIQLELEADELDRKAADARKLADRLRCDAASLIVAELATGKTQQQLAHEIGKSQSHVSLTASARQAYEEDHYLGNEKSFNWYYQQAKKPKVDPHPEDNDEPDDQDDDEPDEQKYSNNADDPLAAWRDDINASDSVSCAIHMVTILLHNLSVVVSPDEKQELIKLLRVSLQRFEM